MRRILLAVLALFLVAAAVPRAHADDDRVSFFNSINVAEGEDAHDLVCIFCSIHIDGAAHGDVVSILGGIRSNGPIDGDAVSILGNINLGRDAHVGGDCVAILGSVRHSANQVGRDLVEIPFVLLLIPVLFFVGIIYLVRMAVYRSRMPYPMPPPPPPPAR
jgi:hypothetical protein